jgi:hypothetical protein
MDRQFDYAQKILLAVEFADAPRPIEAMPASYSLFKRLPITEVVRAFDAAHSLPVRLLAGSKFKAVLERRMGYWETRIPAGLHGFVHYAIGPEDVIAPAYDRLRPDSRFVTVGVYHVEPQSSAYPFSFPSGATPDHWRLGRQFTLTPDSIFWFNFFPEQPYLFEKTFAVWALFQMLQLAGRGENNQLVARDGSGRLTVRDGVEFVQVNLNRFTSLAGFFDAAREAGKHTFTEDKDYAWYGMLLRKL